MFELIDSGQRKVKIGSRISVVVVGAMELMAARTPYRIGDAVMTGGHNSVFLITIGTLMLV